MRCNLLLIYAFSPLYPTARNVSPRLHEPKYVKNLEAGGESGCSSNDSIYMQRRFMQRAIEIVARMVGY